MRFLYPRTGSRPIFTRAVTLLLVAAALITFLGLTDEEVARNILAIKDRVPRSLNAQARVTWKDIRGIQSFGVRRGALKGSTV